MRSLAAEMEGTSAGGLWLGFGRDTGVSVDCFCWLEMTKDVVVLLLVDGFGEIGTFPTEAITPFFTWLFKGGGGVVAFFGRGGRDCDKGG